MPQTKQLGDPLLGCGLPAERHSSFQALHGIYSSKQVVCLIIILYFYIFCGVGGSSTLHKATVFNFFLIIGGISEELEDLNAVDPKEERQNWWMDARVSPGFSVFAQHERKVLLSQRETKSCLSDSFAQDAHPAPCGAIINLPTALIFF